MLLSLRSLVEDFPITSAQKLSSFWVAPYSGAPWIDHDSDTGPVVGSSGGRQFAFAYEVPPAVGTAIVAGRTPAVFAPDAPMALPLTAWWRDFLATPWKSLPSTGVSSTLVMVDQATPPTIGIVAQGGHLPAHFNGTNQFTLSDVGQTWDTVVNGSAGSGWILVKIPSAADKDFLSDASGEIALLAGANGYAELRLNGITLAKRKFNAGEYAMITFRWNGTNAQIGVNEAPGVNGASTVGFSAAVSPLTARFNIGKLNFLGYLDGDVLDVGISDTALSDANFSSVRDYLKTRYGLALAPSPNVFDPATLALTCWYRGHYDNNGANHTWFGAASAGTSFGRDAINVGVAPDVGTAVNGFQPAAFTAANTDILNPPGTLTDCIGANAFSGWFLWKTSNITSTTFAAYEDSSSSLQVEIYDAGLGSLGCRLKVNGSSGTVTLGTTPNGGNLALDTWYLTTFRYTGAALQIGINEAPGARGGSSTAAFSTAIAPLAATTSMGQITGTSGVFSILDSAISKTSYQDADFAKLLAYARDRYALDLPSTP